MWSNIVKITLRNIVRQKLFSFVNILGLSIGLAASFIMLLFVVHEYSFDNHNKNLDRIYRVYTDLPSLDISMWGAPFPLAPIIEETIPEVEKSARAYRVWGTITTDEQQISTSHEKFYSVDSNIFDILTIPIVDGNKDNPLPDINSVLISNTIKKKYFPDEHHFGKLITVNFNDEISTYKISGVFKDLPETSSFKTDFIFPIDLAVKKLKDRAESWRLIGLDLFLLAQEGVEAKLLESKLPKYNDYSKSENNSEIYRLQPYSEVHLNSHFYNSGPQIIDENKIKFFTGVAGIILLLALFNFIILSIARFKYQIKLIGIKKVLGAGRVDISKNVILESLLYSFLSFPISLILIDIFDQHLSSLLNISISDTYYQNIEVLLLFFGLSLFVGLISGLYNFFKLSHLSPLETIRVNRISTSDNVKNRQFLITIQMAVLVGFLFCTIIVFSQTSFFKEKDLGFQIKSGIVLRTHGFGKEKYNSFKTSLLQSPFINNVTASNNLPPTFANTMKTIKDNDDPSILYSAYILAVDKDFFEVFGIEFLEGEESIFHGDGENNRRYFINETALTNFEIGNERVINNRKDKVAGVIKDFNFFSLHQKIPPMLININEEHLWEIFIPYQEKNLSQTMSWVKKKWAEFEPNEEIDYYFYDEKFYEVYKSDYDFAQLVYYASILSILIATLGLLGLIVYTVQQNIKEIGIRKVLGASSFDILRVFLKQFFYLALVSSLVGSFIGYYFMNNWLNDFTYKIDIVFEHFFITVLVTSFIYLATIASYIIKVNRLNPVKVLRNE